MEFVDDGDLYQKIVEHKNTGLLFEEKHIWTVLVEVLIGLQNLHALKILHRDLKVNSLSHLECQYFPQQKRRS